MVSKPRFYVFFKINQVNLSHEKGSKFSPSFFLTSKKLGQNNKGKYPHFQVPFWLSNILVYESMRVDPKPGDLRTERNFRLASLRSVTKDIQLVDPCLFYFYPTFCPSWSRSIINKQSYGNDRKGTWKRGILLLFA